MKNAIKNLKEVEIELENIEALFKNTKESTYYTVFNRPNEKALDLRGLDSRKKKLLSKKFMLLENLQLDIEKEKAYVSEQQKNINLKSA